MWAVWAGRTWARSPLRTFLLIMHALEIDTAQADAGIVGVRTVGGVGVTLVAIFARVPDAISAPRAGTVDAAHVWRVGVGQTVVALLAEPCIVDPVAARCEPLPEASSLHFRRLGGCVRNGSAAYRAPSSSVMVPVT